MNRMFLAFGWVAVLVLSACRPPNNTSPVPSQASDAGTEVKPDFTYTLDDVGRVLSKEICASLKRCIGDDLFHLYVDADFSNCEVSRRSEFERERLPLIREALGRGRLEFRAANIEASVTAFRTLSCDAFNIDDTTFARVFQGLVADGAPCVLHEECNSESFCQKKAACPGVCTPRLKPDSTALCENDSRECTSDAYCSAGVCRKVVALDAACDDDVNPCPGLAQCVGATVFAGSGRTCKTAQDLSSAFVGQGQACDDLLCRAPWVCAYDVAQQKDTCMTKKNLGETCTSGRYMNSCPTGAFCAGLDAAQNDFEGTCETRRQENQPCSIADGDACAEGLYCAAKRACAVKKEVGASCAETFECQSGKCEVNVCVNDLVCRHADLP